MQEITVEMILATVRKELNQLEEKYQQSKSPKKEWEIVAFKLEDRIYRLTNDDQYRDVNPAYSDGVAYFGVDYAFEPKNNCTIHSARRLSDDIIFSRQEMVDTPSDGRRIIEGFEIDGVDLLVKMGRGYLGFSAIKKLPASVLVTEDGVEVYSWDNFKPTIVFGDSSLRADAYEDYWLSAKASYPDAKLFSTREAAEKYILDHAPKLSLNDVKEALEASFCIETAVEKLTALVKQRLNQ